MQGIDPTVIEDSQDKLLNKVLFYPWQSNPLSYSPTIQTRTAIGALSILESFGFSKLSNAFKEVGGVHQVWNLLTLECDLRSLFDTLELWFEHTEKVCYSETCQPHQFTMLQVHRYRVCTLDGDQEAFIRSIFKGGDRHINGAPMFVEFNGQFEKASPPDPLLLGLPAACARVTHMSGAAEFFDQIERDAEDTRVLAFDGSSAPLLSNLLSPHSVIRGVA